MLAHQLTCCLGDLYLTLACQAQSGFLWFQSNFLLICILRKQWMMAQVLWSLPPTWAARQSPCLMALGCSRLTAVGVQLAFMASMRVIRAASQMTTIPQFLDMLFSALKGKSVIMYRMPRRELLGIIPPLLVMQSHHFQWPLCPVRLLGRSFNSWDVPTSPSL